MKGTNLTICRKVGDCGSQRSFIVWFSNPLETPTVFIWSCNFCSDSVQGTNVIQYLSMLVHFSVFLFNGLCILFEFVIVVVVDFILSRLLHLAYSAHLGLLCMPHPGMGPLV